IWEIKNTTLSKCSGYKSNKDEKPCIHIMDCKKAAALSFYILSALFIDNFVIIFVMTVLLAALDFWLVKNASGRILVVIRPDEQERFMAFLVNALPYIAWTMLAIFSLIRLQADYLLVVGVCLTLSIANIVGFTKCQIDTKKPIQQFASQTIASQVSSTFSVV
ncbi:Golgi apparatus membrane protein-like protein ECHIDNA, partial [Glycine soja]